MSSESRGSVPTELLQRLEAHDARLAVLVERLQGGEPVTTPGAAVGGESIPAVGQPIVAREGGLGVAMAILVLVATLLTVSIAIFDYNADPNPPSRRGLMASFRYELTGVVQISQRNAQQRAYADALLHEELAKRIRAEIADVPQAQRPALLAEAEHATRTAAASGIFFPRRYLNRDGTFDEERQLGESWAQAQREVDLDAQKHFQLADQLRSYAAYLTNLVFFLTIALCILELVDNLHPRRSIVRIASVAAAAMCIAVVAVMLGMYLIA